MSKNQKFDNNRICTTLVLLKYHINQSKMLKNHKFGKNRKGTTLVL